MRKNASSAAAAAAAIRRSGASRHAARERPYPGAKQSSGGYRGSGGLRWLRRLRDGLRAPQT